MTSLVRPKRITLSGYYGFRNAGDEAVLAGLIKGLRSLPIGTEAAVDITALSINPAATHAEHGIKAAHRYKPVALLGALARCDLLASGGGSLLQDATSKHSIFYYLAVVRVAQIMGKKTMFIAQGIGPLALPRSRRLTAATANRCSAVTVRDDASAELLSEMGVTRPRIYTTADPALLLGAGLPYDANLGAAVSLRSWKDAPPGFPVMVAKACAQAIGAPSVASMMMSPEDASVHDAFFDNFIEGFGQPQGERLEANAPNWSALSRVAASSSLVIGMRLHALILAAANGVPAVALSYDPKVNAFMRQSGQGDAILDVRSADSDGLTSLISKVWNERDERAHRLGSALPALEAAAARNAEIALSLL